MEERSHEWKRRGTAFIILGLFFFILAFLVFVLYDMPRQDFVKSVFVLVLAVVFIVIGKKSYNFG